MKEQTTNYNTNDNRMEKVLARITASKSQAADMESEVWLKLFDCIGTVSESLASVADRLLTLEKKVVEQSQKMSMQHESLRNELKNHSKQLGLVSSTLIALENNTDQIRLISERIADKVDETTTEFIDRHVVEPLFKHVGMLYNAVRDMVNTAAEEAGKTVAESLLEHAQTLTASVGIRLIEPGVGAEFNPREHRITETTTTADKSLDRKIAATYRAGFGRNGRVIQDAIVKLYEYQKPTKTNKIKEVNEDEQ